MATIIGKLAREVGYVNVDQVHDGYSALDRLREKKYGLLLSDWDMRPMNGTELTSSAQRSDEFSHPIIMLRRAKLRRVQLGS